MGESETAAQRIAQRYVDGVTPRRANVATLLQMLHEERMAFAQRKSDGGGYTADLKRGNSSTNMGVIAIDLHGAQREGQTTEDFIEEHAALFETLCARFPMPDGYVRAK